MSVVTAKRAATSRRCSFDGMVIQSGTPAVRLFNDIWLAIPNVDWFSERVRERADSGDYGAIGKWPWTCLLLPPTDESSRHDAVSDASEGLEDLVGDNTCDTRRVLEAKMYDIDSRIEGTRCAMCGESDDGAAILYFGHRKWIHASCSEELVAEIEQTLYNGASVDFLVEELNDIAEEF